MQQLYSLWLLPCAEDSDLLSALIQELAEVHHSPLFLPHLTLASPIWLEESSLDARLRPLFSGHASFSLMSRELSHSEAFFRAVVIETESSPALLALRQQVLPLSEDAAAKPFLPHISLIYKEMPERERKNLLKTLPAFPDFRFDRICAVATQSPVSGWTPAWMMDLPDKFVG